MVMRRSSLKGAIERRYGSGRSYSPGSRTLTRALRHPSRQLDTTIRPDNRPDGSMHLPRGQNERGAGASACRAGPPSSGQTFGFEFNLSRQSADGGDMSDVDSIRWLASEHDLEFVDLDTYGVDPAAAKFSRHRSPDVTMWWPSSAIRDSGGGHGRPRRPDSPGDGPGQHRAGLHLRGCFSGPDRQLPRPAVRTGELERESRWSRSGMSSSSDSPWTR